MSSANTLPQPRTLRRPNLFVVGAPKSGTTSLNAYLSEHPEIFMSPRREPGYFSPDIPYPVRNETFEYSRDEQSYLALFAGAADEKRIGEKSTHYMASRKAPELIRQFASEAKIVCILRDPAYVAYAWHGERVFRGVEENDRFDLAFLDQPGSAPYLQVGLYGSQLTRWFEHLGRENVHPIIFDDFRADTAGEYRRLLEFLGVDPGFRPESFDVHNAATTKSPLIRQLRARPARAVAGVARGLLGKRMARRLSRAIRRAPVVNRTGGRTPISEEVRLKLQEVYEAEVELAGQLLGRDLRSLWWRAGDG